MATWGEEMKPTSLRRIASDQEIRTSALSELRSDPEVELPPDDVAVEDEAIAPKGTAGIPVGRNVVQGRAERVNGVTAVLDDTDLRDSSEHSIRDVETARAATDCLERNTLLPTGCIRVTVSNGWATLEGDLDCPYKRKVAEKVVSGMIGIRGVSNLITVGRPSALADQIKQEAIKQRIEDSLRRTAELAARGIVVRARGGTVTLGGTVCSRLERRQAEEVTASMPGVSKVESSIAVSRLSGKCLPKSGPRSRHPSVILMAERWGPRA
jgi:osmotically-inducible protein OsmY